LKCPTVCAHQLLQHHQRWNFALTTLQRAKRLADYRADSFAGIESFLRVASGRTGGEQIAGLDRRDVGIHLAVRERAERYHHAHPLVLYNLLIPKSVGRRGELFQRVLGGRTFFGLGIIALD
jgi:hypothetical protein